MLCKQRECKKGIDMNTYIRRTNRHLFGCSSLRFVRLKHGLNVFSRRPREQILLKYNVKVRKFTIFKVVFA